MLLTLVRRYSSTRIPAPAFTPLPSRKPMLGSRSVATTIRWQRIFLPPAVTTSKILPSTSVTSAISVPSWTFTPRARSRSVTRTSTSPALGCPHRDPLRVPEGGEEQERSRCAHQRQGKDRPAPRRHAQEVVRLLGAVGKGHPVPRRVDAAGAFPARKPDPEVRKGLLLR